MSIKIYTDGACKGNPGDGGWGALIIYPNNEEEIFGYEENTTNNRMELLAAIKALEAIREKKEVELIDIKKSNINYFLITFIEIEDFKSSTEIN